MLMKIKWVRVVFFVLIFFSLEMPAIFAQNFDADISRLLNNWRKENNVVGAVLLINAPNKNEVFTSGTINIQSTMPVTANTLFGVGSITKTFISAMILRLEAEEKINIQDKLGDYLSQYPRWSNITIQQLLNMTSGIPNYSDDIKYQMDLQKNFPHTWTRDQLINISYEHTDYFKPGKGWSYSNTNYLLLAKIIETITKTPLKTELNEQFFQPLELSNSFYSEKKYSATIIQNMACGYNEGRNMSMMNPANLGAAGGGMVMSAKDLENWVYHLLIKQDVLPKTQLDEMLNTVPVTNVSLYPPNTGYGLGVLISKNKTQGDLIWYTGVIPGYTSTFEWLPKKQTLILIEASLNQVNEKNFNILFPNQALLKKIFNDLIGTEINR